VAEAVAISVSDGVAIVMVGENQCGQLWEALAPYARERLRAVVLDFANVGYLNSMNIASVISLRNKLMEQDVGLLLCNVRENIRSVFRILKLERLFNLELGIEQALDAAKSR
jgi:anti-anti-sigma factor